MSLKNKTLSGVFWSFIQNIGAKGVSLIATILLARLLTPEDFGLIGMLAVFIEISQALVVAGFNQALIQKKDPDEEDFSSVFWINLSLSVVLYVALFFLAPFIANFYEQPILVNLTRVLTLLFVINAFSYVQEAKLRKEMRFKTLMFVHLPSTIISVIVAIAMALSGFGVWSIVGQQLSMRLAYAIQIWFHAKWRPLWVFNKQKAKGLFSFGSKLMISGVLDAAFRNIYLVIIGRFFPVATLGYYQNAKKLVDTPTKTLSTVLKNVTFSAFSTIQDNDQKLKKGYKMVIQQILFWLCPILVISAVLATPLFSLVLTDKWLPAVPFFQFLCVVGILYPLQAYNLEIVNVKGRSDIFLKLEIIKKALTVISVIIAIPYGIWVLVATQVFNSLIAYVINSHYTGKFIGYPVGEQLKDVFPIVGITVLAGAAVYTSISMLNTMADWQQLLVGYVVGGVIYWGLSHVIHVDPYHDFLNIIKENKHRLTLKRTKQ